MDVDMERWESTCDRCGQYVPPERNTEENRAFWAGTASAVSEHGVQIIIGYGLCRHCYEMEAAV
jgi:hypothetical protein